MADNLLTGVSHNTAAGFTKTHTHKELTFSERSIVRAFLTDIGTGQRGFGSFRSCPVTTGAGSFFFFTGYPFPRVTALPSQRLNFSASSFLP
jgi:hypothetical protein